MLQIVAYINIDSSGVIYNHNSTIPFTSVPLLSAVFFPDLFAQQDPISFHKLEGKMQRPLTTHDSEYITAVFISVSTIRC